MLSSAERTGNSPVAHVLHRLLVAIYVLAFSGVAIFYASNARRAFPHPLSTFPRISLTAIYWAGATLLGSLIVWWVLNKPWQRRIALGLIALAWCGLVVAGGSCFRLAGAVSLVLVATALGCGILHRLGIKGGSYVFHTSLSYFIGMILLSLFTLGLGLLQALQPLFLTLELLFAAALAAMLYGDRWRVGRAIGVSSVLPLPAPALNPGERLLIALPLSAMIVALCGASVRALAPETSIDGLNYHLAVPQAFLAHGGFYAIGSYHSGFAHNMESIYLLALFLGDSGTANITHLSFVLAALAATYELGRLLAGPVVGLLAAAFIGSFPLGFGAMPVCGTDWPAMFGATLTLCCWARWWQDDSKVWSLAGAFCLGATLSLKLSSIYLLGPALVCFIAAAFWRKHWSALGLLGPCGVALVVVACPWFLVHAWYLGNPFFPLLNDIFKSPYFRPDRGFSLYQNCGVGRSLSSVLSLPLRTTDRNVFGDYWPRGALGPVSLYSVIALLLWFYWSKVQRFAAVLAIAFGLYWGYANQYLRFYMVGFPLLAAVASSALLLAWNRLAGFRGALAGRWLVGVALMIAVLAQIPPSMWCGECFSLFDDLPWAVAAGRETRESYLIRKIPAYRAHQWLMQHATDGLIIGDDPWRFYAPAGKYFVFWEWPILDLAGCTEKTAGDYLKKRGFRYLVLARGRSGFGFYSPAFLSQQDLVYQDDATNVYRLR